MRISKQFKCKDLRKIVLWTFSLQSLIRLYVRCCVLNGSDLLSSKGYIHYFQIQIVIDTHSLFFSKAGPRWRGAGFGSSLSCRANCHWQALPIPAHRGTSTNANFFRNLADSCCYNLCRWRKKIDFEYNTFVSKSNFLLKVKRYQHLFIKIGLFWEDIVVKL